MIKKRSIVISINPTHVDNILNGIKTFEYRTKAAKHDVGRIIIYETTPIKKIVAEVEIVSVLTMEPDLLWEETKDGSGISKEYFDRYFKNRHIAYAYRLGEIKVYKKPKELQDFGLKCAPQSFVYIN